jgi:integrase/recombinase XerD
MRSRYNRKYRQFGKLSVYFACVRKFLVAAGKPPDALARDDVKSHLFRILDSGKCSVSTMNQNYSALKYFFRVTLSKPWELDGIPRVKRQTRLPPILSKEEALAVIRHAANVKHRALLALVYGSGLRVGEIPKLTTADIIRDKLRLKITQGKGAKDRYALLSSLCLDYLGFYWRCYRPTGPLFEGRVDACEQFGLPENPCPPLRVSFQTHSGKPKIRVSHAAGMTPY